MKRIFTVPDNWPLVRKMTAVVVLISGLLIAIISVVVSVEKRITFRTKLVNNSTVLAQVIGANSAATLVYDDPETAGEILGALAAEEDVLGAALYGEAGKLFVSYTSPRRGPDAVGVLPRAISPAVLENPRFFEDHFDVTSTIVLEKRTIGYIVLRTSLEPLKRQLRKFWWMVAGLSILLLSGGMLLCLRLNNAIVGPVSELADTMQRVTATQDYGARVNKLHDDEIGILVDGFNNMLATIQYREEELEHHRNNLEGLVETRTRELKRANDKIVNEIKERQQIQEQLAHAEKMKAIGALAGGVAHDLNNILSGVVSYPDLLLLTLPEDSKMREPIKKIQASGMKAAAIVNDLLTLARRGVKVEERVDLEEVVSSYLNSPELKEVLKDHPEVKIEFAKAEESCIMLGSPVHLSKTVMNLVTNGIEAMEGGGVLSIALERTFLVTRPPEFEQWSEGAYICLSIADTGAGIPEEVQKRIFEPFYSRKVMGKSGTGLGMAVVWGTVEDHRGHIELISKENEGTTFKLYFPAEECQRLESTERGPLKDPAEELFQGAGLTVLVVDDVEEQRRIASEVFGRLGCAVDCVDSGEAAVSYLKNHSVDLVVLDMLMAPGIDGLECFKRIVAFKSGQKAVIASGYSQLSDIEEAKRLGVLDYVMKPYTLHHISRMLHRVFP